MTRTVSTDIIVRVEYDANVPATYVRYRDGAVARTVESNDCEWRDYDAAGRLLGIERIGCRP